MIKMYQKSKAHGQNKEEPRFEDTTEVGLLSPTSQCLGIDRNQSVSAIILQELPSLSGVLLFVMQGGYLVKNQRNRQICLTLQSAPISTTLHSPQIKADLMPFDSTALMPQNH